MLEGISSMEELLSGKVKSLNLWIEWSGKKILHSDIWPKI